MPPSANQECQSPSAARNVHWENDASQVAQFYNDREVLITGGTGFVGKAFVHVSTAYCNCDKPDADEVISPQSENIRNFFENYAASAVTGSTVTKECLFGHPNTYTLTKSITESLLLEERGNIPVVIVRPSIVTAALNDPLPGWVDNYKACTGLVVALATGQISSMITEKNCLVDIVPVDIVANTLICVAWHTSATRPTEVKVYHCASGTLQQYKWADLADAMQKAILRHPLPNTTFYPKFIVTNSHLWHSINLYCLRYLPARAADLGLMLIGREPRFVQRYKRLFNIDVRSLDWYAYWDLYLLGIRKYLFKAEDSDLPRDESHLNKLYLVRLTSQGLLLALACRLLTTKTVWKLGSTMVMLSLKRCETLLDRLGLQTRLQRAVEIYCASSNHAL
ncbi:hypothetical protein MTO96_000858 [Rhipicephalus appendiculatus]